jgi:hypothetical protein
MKQKLETLWGKPGDSYYIIGGSSPWLSKYTVASLQQVSKSVARAVIRYEWVTSAGPSKPTGQALTMIRQGGMWQVDAVSGSQGLQ